MQLTLRDFFMRLPLIPGIGLKTTTTCWRWVEAQPELTTMTAATVTQLCREMAIQQPRPTSSSVNFHRKLPPR